MKLVVADKQHDKSLRQMIRETPIPGTISVAYEREPSFFHSMDVTGDACQVMAAIEEDQVIGMGCRSLANYWINGEIKRFGYLSGLRSRVNRMSTSLVKAYSLLEELHQEDPVDGYFSTVIKGNDRATKVLTNGTRIGLPTYTDFGTYHTRLLQLNRRQKFPDSCCNIVSGDTIPPARIVEFLNTEGKRRQFFPMWSVDDFHSPRLRDLRLRDIYVAMDNDRIIGIVGAWDQSRFKQHRVVSYNGVMNLFRPGINLGLRLTGHQSLPSPGSFVRSKNLCMVCIKDDSVDILCSLINVAYREAAQEDHHFLNIGFHESDPFSTTIESYPGIDYASTLYLVNWASESDIRAQLDDRVPYLEPACL